MVAKVVSIILFYKAKAEKIVSALGMLFVPPKEKNKRDLSYYMQNY